jgi:hypothetical protein
MRARATSAAARAAAAALAVCVLGLAPPTRAALVAIEPGLPAALFLLGVAWFLLRWSGGRARRLVARTEPAVLRFLERWGWALTVLAFLTPLLASWDLRPPNGNAAFAALFGRIPWGDAHGHFEGAQRLLAEGAFPYFSGRRPLNAAWLSVRLWLAGGRLEAALIVQAVLLGAATFAAARVVGARRGLAPALAFTGLVLGLSGDYLPTAATEPLGITLACAALAVLWAPAARGRLVPALIGLWLLDLSLQARPGAQLLLPCLGLWVVWTCRRAWVRAAAGVVLVALAGTLLSAALNRFYGTSDSSASSAAAYPFYGLVTGSNYRQIREDLGPELAALPDERARTRLIYRRGWERFRDDPGVALGALGRNLRKFAGKTPAVLYGVVSPQSLLLSPWARAEPTPRVLARDRWLGRLLLAIALLAFARYAWRARTDERLFWLAAALGVVLSAPVVYGDAGLRGLAASFPLLAGLLAIGLGARRLSPPIDTLETRTRVALSVCAVALVALALVGPAIAHRSQARPARESLTPGTLVVRLRPAPAIVVSSREQPDVDVPVLPRRQFERHLALANVAASGFDRPDPPFALVSAYDWVAQRQRVLVIAPEALRETNFLRLRAAPAAEDENLQVVSEWSPLAPVK